MVPQSLVYQGGLRCVATHGPSGVSLTTDAPTDNLGRGEFFSPSDLLVTALASCKLTTMAIFADRHNVKLDGCKIYAEKHMSVSGPRRIERIVMKIEFCAGIAADMRDKLENVAKACPVAKSLSESVVQEVAFHYPD